MESEIRFSIWWNLVLNHLNVSVNLENLKYFSIQKCYHSVALIYLRIKNNVLDKNKSVFLYCIMLKLKKFWEIQIDKNIHEILSSVGRDYIWFSSVYENSKLLAKTFD